MPRTGFAEDEDPISELRAAAQTRREAERTLATLVRRARHHGASWRMIAIALETKPRTLRRKYGKA